MSNFVYMFVLKEFIVVTLLCNVNAIGVRMCVPAKCFFDFVIFGKLK